MKHTIIEHETDARTGRTGYRITGPSFAAVQNAIHDLSAAPGTASRFTIPKLVDGAYHALGDVRPLPANAEAA